MSAKHYDWSGGPAQIEDHSLTKQEVLVDYIRRYLKQCTLLPEMDVFRMTLVDGFCGGGVYVREQDPGTIVLGSPLQMLDAVESASKEINLLRQKPIRFDIQFIFVDVNRTATTFLREQLIQRGYGSRLGNSIWILTDKFTKVCDQIIRKVCDHTRRSPRALFFLDQYGYSKIPMPVIAEIFKRIGHAEVILNLHTSSLMTYINDEILERACQSLGITDVRAALGGHSVADLKRTEAGARKLIQCALYRSVVDGCQAKHYTPFFIRGRAGHGEYWLLHLSQKHRARDVMSRVTWERSNSFIHYGGAGLGMLNVEMMGFDQQLDDHNADNGYLFDDDARTLSTQQLRNDLAPIIYSLQGPITFQGLYERYCNECPGDAELFKLSIMELVDAKEITVRTTDGGRRESALRIHDSDIVEHSGTMSMFSLG